MNEQINEWKNEWMTSVVINWLQINNVIISARITWGKPVSHPTKPIHKPVLRFVYQNNMRISFECILRQARRQGGKFTKQQIIVIPQHFWPEVKYSLKTSFKFHLIRWNSNDVFVHYCGFNSSMKYKFFWNSHSIWFESSRQKWFIVWPHSMCSNLPKKSHLQTHIYLFVDISWGSANCPTLLHSPSLVAIGLTVGFDTWPPIGWHHPLVIDWFIYSLVSSVALHYGSRDRWEFPPFLRPPRQSHCTALPLGLCKRTVKESTTDRSTDQVSEGTLTNQWLRH